MSLSVAITVIVPLAFLMGFALQRGQICCVLAARQIVETGQASRLRGLSYASLWALAVVVPLGWVLPEKFVMSPAYQVSWTTILAGIAYGLGAFISGACVFGICSRAVSGSLHFLAAVPGIAIGAALSIKYGAATLLGAPQSSPLAGQGAVSALGLAIAAPAAGLLAWRLVKGHARAGLGLKRVLAAGRWRSSLALAVIGVAGGLLFATGETWHYPGLLRKGGAMIVGQSGVLAPATIVGPLALFSGAVASLFLGGRFSFRIPTFAHTARSFLGGIIMGAAAALIPGGNDVMVLYAIPGLALQGFLAFVAMMATLVGLGRLAAHLPARVSSRPLAEAKA
jgi:hypothetical protein